MMSYNENNTEATPNKMCTITRMIILRRAITYIGDNVELQKIKCCCEQYLNHIISHGSSFDLTIDNILKKDTGSCDDIMKLKQLISYCWHEIITSLRFYHNGETECVELEKVKIGDNYTNFELWNALNEDGEYCSSFITQLVTMHRYKCMMSKNTREHILTINDMTNKLAYIMFVLSMLSNNGYLIEDMSKMIMIEVFYVI